MIEFAVAGLTEPVSATVPWLSISILLPIVGALLVPFHAGVNLALRERAWREGRKETL